MNNVPGNIKLEDFLQNHVLTNLKIDDSWTFGLYFAYTLDKAADCWHRQVQLLRLDDYSIEKLDLPFEPDDYTLKQSEIIFKVIRDDRTLFYRYDQQSRTITERAEVPFSVQQFAFDAAALYFSAVTNATNGSERRGGAAFCTEYGPVYQEGRGITGSTVKGLFQARQDGKDITLITALDMDVDQIDFDFPNGRILFNAFSKERLKPIASSLYLFDIRKHDLRILCDKPFRIGNVQSMSADLVLFTGVNLQEFSRNDNQQLYQIALDTGILRPLGNFIDLSNESPAIVTDSYFSTSLPIQKDGDVFYSKRVERDREMLWRTWPDGRSEPVETGLTVIGSFQVRAGGIIAVGLRGMQLSEVYSIEEGTPRQLSAHNRWAEELQTARPVPVTETINGVEIDGYVYPPVRRPGREENREREESEPRCPAVLMIHGGPKMLYAAVYSHEIQLLCASGYYVFCANPMGSDGRGNAFADIRGRFGSLPYEQLMIFTDRILERYPRIDRNRLGVSGGSYGGYMTNCIITRTDRFKAAVSERSISSLLTSFTTSDIGYQFVYEYLGNTPAPWTAREELIEASPIFQADRAVTPTLFIHGKDDYRCHHTESVSMFSALNYHGVPARLCLFEHENHSLPVRGKPQSKRRRYEEFLTWFNTYLKSEAAGQQL